MSTLDIWVPVYVQFIVAFVEPAYTFWPEVGFVTFITGRMLKAAVVSFTSSMPVMLWMIFTRHDDSFFLSGMGVHW